MFHHEGKGISGAVHGDDFTFLGFDEDLCELEELLKSWFELKYEEDWDPMKRTTKKL